MKTSLLSLYIEKHLKWRALDVLKLFFIRDVASRWFVLEDSGFRLRGTEAALRRDCAGFARRRARPPGGAAVSGPGKGGGGGGRWWWGGGRGWGGGGGSPRCPPGLAWGISGNPGDRLFPRIPGRESLKEGKRKNSFLKKNKGMGEGGHSCLLTQGEAGKQRSPLLSVGSRVWASLGNEATPKKNCWEQGFHSVSRAGTKVVNIKCWLLSDAATRTPMRLRQQYDIGTGNVRL